MSVFLKGYGPAVKAEDEDRHMNVNVSSSGQGTKTVILQIPKVCLKKFIVENLLTVSFLGYQVNKEQGEEEEEEESCVKTI